MQQQYVSLQPNINYAYCADFCQKIVIRNRTMLALISYVHVLGKLFEINVHLSSYIFLPEFGIYPIKNYRGYVRITGGNGGRMLIL